MAQVFADLADLAKEVWTQDRLAKQFYNKRLWLDRVEKIDKYTIGREAKVPLELSLPGGGSARPASGIHSINAADELHTDVANYQLVQLDQQVSFDFGTVAQSVGPGVHSAIDGVDQLIMSNVDALRADANRMAVSNGDALIAKTTGTGTSTEVELDPNGYGYDAIVRGWLREGLSVEIGSATDHDSVTGAGTPRVIQAVEESPSTPSITVSGAAVTVTGNDFVSIAGNRVNNTAVYETNGLRNIAGSMTASLGGISPATVPQWKPAEVDTDTRLPTLDLILRLQRKVKQKTGKWPTFVTTSLKVQADLYTQYQSQVRFSSDSSTAAGDVEGFTWNNTKITADPDIPDRELYLLTLEDLFCVTGAGPLSKPTWISEVQGIKRGFHWIQGQTGFVDVLVYFLQLGVKRRNSHAAALGLTG